MQLRMMIWKLPKRLNVFFTDVINGDSTSIGDILTGYSDHPSVLKIKETENQSKLF